MRVQILFSRGFILTIKLNFEDLGGKKLKGDTNFSGFDIYRKELGFVTNFNFLIPIQV